MSPLWPLAHIQGAIVRRAGRSEDAADNDAVFEDVVVFQIRPDRRAFEDQLLGHRGAAHRWRTFISPTTSTQICLMPRTWTWHPLVTLAKFPALSDAGDQSLPARFCPLDLVDFRAI